jgi:hypothetical protein
MAQVDLNIRQRRLTTLFNHFNLKVERWNRQQVEIHGGGFSGGDKNNPTHNYYRDEFIKDGYNGFLSDPSDLDNFCNKIISFSELISEEKINMINNCAESVISYKNNISIMPLINNLNLIYEKH